MELTNTYDPDTNIVIGDTTTPLPEYTTMTVVAFEEAKRVAANTARYAAESEFQTWKDDVTAQAHEYANNNNLCGEFDRFMVSIGLRPRTCTYTVTVSVTTSVEVEIEARNAEDAERAITRDQVSDAVQSHFGYGNAHYTNYDFEVTDVEEID